MPGEAGHGFDVAGEHGVGGDHHVGVAQGLAQGVTVQAVQDGEAEMGGEFGELGGPVGDERGGDDDEGGAVEPSVLMFDADMGDGLGGFAKAHVVGEEAAEVVGPQMLEPVDALLLIGAQRGFEGVGQGGVGDVGLAAVAIGVGFDGGGVFVAGEQELFEINDACDLGAVEQQDVVGCAAGGFDEVAEDGEEAADALGGEAEDSAIVEAGDDFAVDDLGLREAALVEQALQADAAPIGAGRLDVRQRRLSRPR